MSRACLARPISGERFLLRLSSEHTGFAFEKTILGVADAVSYIYVVFLYVISVIISKGTTTQRWQALSGASDDGV